MKRDCGIPAPAALREREILQIFAKYDLKESRGVLLQYPRELI